MIYGRNVRQALSCMLSEGATTHYRSIATLREYLMYAARRS